MLSDIVNSKAFLNSNDLKFCYYVQNLLIRFLKLLLKEYVLLNI